MMKKNLKKATVAVAALSLVVSGIPTTAFPQNMAIVNASVDDEIFEAGNLRYKVTGKNTEVIILGFTESAAEKTTLSIPDTVNYDDYDFPVTSIANTAFKDNTSITSIVFTDKDGKESSKTNLAKIGESAFEGCTGLTTVTLAEGVTTLSRSTFGKCSNLTTVNLPSTITTVDDGRSPFYGCTGLQKVTFAEGTTTIPNHIFYECDFITGENFNVPATVTVIGESAFSGLTQLDSIVLPEGLQEIGRTAFRGCTALTSIQLPESLTTLGSNSFKECDGLTEVTIPKNMAAVDTDLSANSPFNECKNLTKVVLEEGMKTIPAYILKNASSVKEVTIPETVTTIDEGSFEGLTQLKSVTFPKNMEVIERNAFRECSSLATVTLPETLTTLGSRSFSACNRLKEITLPKTLTTVITNLSADSPFSENENLTKVVFEEGMKTIPAYILKNASSVKEVTIPETVTTIEEASFEGLTQLETVTLPKNLEVIDRYAFNNCSSLTAVTFPEALTTLGSKSFGACNRLTEITLPKTLTTVMTNLSANSPFSECENLKKVVFEEGAEVVPEYILNGASYVEEVSIPDTVTKIERAAFYGCTNLTSVILPASLSSIGSNSFYSCDGLTEITLPKTLTTVETNLSNNSPFNKCENLGKVTFQDGTIVVPNYILRDVNSVKQVVIPSSVTDIQKNAFDNITKNITIYGYTNSYAETYAKENDIPFISNGEMTIEPTPGITPTAPAETVTPTAPVETVTPTAPAETVTPTAPVETVTPTAPAETVSPTAPVATVKPTTAPVKAPKKVTVSSVKRNSAKKATVKWKKISGVDGYQVTYAAKSNFKGAKTKNVAKSKNSYVITGLKKGQVYYVKVRAYKKNSKGTKIMGSYSAVKKIKK